MVRFSHDLLSIKSVTSPPEEPILGDFMKYLRNISSQTLRGGGRHTPLYYWERKVKSGREIFSNLIFFADTLAFSGAALYKHS